MPEPPATAEELASPRAYAARMSRGMGIPLPLDEVLASFRFDAEGHFVGSATEPSVIQQIVAGIRSPDYSRLRAPTLALYAHADHWMEDYAGFIKSQREHVARALPSARVVAIPHAKHYLFLTHRDEVVRELLRFLAELDLASR